jgi:predicted DNA-binding transcriptional regulator AlpA
MVKAKTKRPILKRRPLKPITERELPPARPNRLMQSSEVCHRCGDITRKTLWVWVKEGIYPAPIVINGRNFFDEAKHEEFIARHSKTTEAA